MTNRYLRRYLATISYIGMIVLINVLFVNLPGVAAFGQSFSLADLIVGSIYIVRDFAQREIKHYIFIAMLVGAGISYLLADKTIAIASLAAFLVGETLDWAIFTYTRKPLSQRLIWSSVISSPVDSYVFLAVAHRLHSLEFAIMTLGKIIGILILWLIWQKMATKKRVPA
jgi:uncharacterized PurR-regulated membrane protein YhhQ (DUF165 family)